MGFRSFLEFTQMQAFIFSGRASLIIKNTVNSNFGREFSWKTTMNDRLRGCIITGIMKLFIFCIVILFFIILHWSFTLSSSIIQDIITHNNNWFSYYSSNSLAKDTNLSMLFTAYATIALVTDNFYTLFTWTIFSTRIQRYFVVYSVLFFLVCNLIFNTFVSDETLLIFLSEGFVIS